MWTVKSCGAGFESTAWAPSSALESSPAKLLARLYREKLSRSYKKVLDGATLFRALSPEKAAEKCPYLLLLLNEMIQLAQSEA